MLTLCEVLPPRAGGASDSERAAHVSGVDPTSCRCRPYLLQVPSSPTPCVPGLSRSLRTHLALTSLAQLGEDGIESDDTRAGGGGDGDVPISRDLKMVMRGSGGSCDDEDGLQA
jgi:hypothetical protein